MKSDFLLAVTQLATERRLPRDVVVDAIEAALVSAFKKEVVGSDNISVKILPTTGDIVLTIHKIIVDCNLPDELISFGIGFILDFSDNLF